MVKKSFQIYHAFFTIGGFLAPLLVGVFKESESVKNCGGENTDDTPTNNNTGGFLNSDLIYKYVANFLNLESLWTQEGDSYWDQLDKDIIPPYLIVGGFVFVCSIYTFICAIYGVAENLSEAKKEEIDLREEGTGFKTLIDTKETSIECSIP